MSTRLALLAVMAAVLVMPTNASAAEWGLDTWKKRSLQSEWEGYAVGTTYTTRTTTKGKMAGREINNVSETRLTLMKITDTEYHIKNETKAMGTWLPATITKKPRKKDVKFETKEVGSETVKVAGTDYPCKKIIGTKIEKGERSTMTFLVHDSEGVLQYEMDQVTEGRKMRIKGLVTKLAAKKTIGAHTFECRELDMTITMPGMGEMKRKQVMTNDCPAGSLFSTGTMSRGGMGSMTTTTEIVAVTLKK